MPELFEAYAQARARLATGEPLGWTLRRYERDLLDALGFAFDWSNDGEGTPIDPAARYRLDPEYGPRRVLSDRGHGDRSSAATGRALLSLASDQHPEADDLPGLRRAMRGLLSHYLGPRGLKSWEMLAELGRVAPRAKADQAGAGD